MGGVNGGKVVAIADNYITGTVMGIPVIKPEDIPNIDYDYVCIATQMVSSAISQLLSIGVDYYRICTTYLINEGIGAREIFLRHFSREVENKKIQGNVAEAGVLRGDFAAIINECFPNRSLYLFDTFTGFDKRDEEKERLKAENPIQNYSYYENTTESIVMSKMKYPDNVQCIRGYVPESLPEVDDVFCFVNLDMDLYQPTKEALRWFYPRINAGGGILVHDFYNDRMFPNLKESVIEFCRENKNIDYYPIGDGMSVFIPKLDEIKDF